MKNNFLHTDFKLNGTIFHSKTELLLYTKNHLKGIHSFLSNWFDESDFIRVTTSGSTGKPKTIQLKKRYMINSAKATGSFFNLSNETTALMCLNVKFIAGKMMLVRAMILGWNLDIVAPDSNPLKHIDKKYHFSAMVPMQLYNSLDKISQIKQLIVGGGIVSPELKERIRILPTKIYQTYGMTETVTHVALKPLNRSAGSTAENNFYQTLPQINISRDKRECLIIDAPLISDNKVITNDLVEIYSKNKFKWLGRYDHIINSGGIKLIPEQIEEKLASLIEQRFFVSSMSDSILGEKLILVVEGAEQRDLLKKIATFHKENRTILNNFEIPKEIYFVKKFIETGTKKLKRNEIIDIINS
jgi:o-succinylbenzoate---CoA ligase